jgi:hypothetical protein
VPDYRDDFDDSLEHFAVELQFAAEQYLTMWA